MINIINAKIEELAVLEKDPNTWLQQKHDQLKEIVGSRKMLTLILTNKSQPTVEQLAGIAESLGVKMQDLVRNKHKEHQAA